MKRILVNSTKAGTMMNELVVDDFLKESILVPSAEEQQLIGSFFNSIDVRISLGKQELNKLQTLKKGLLEKMFV
jgi:type I restriction enzyme S subunit